VARGTYTGEAIEDLSDIFVADAWHDTHVHFGGRLAFADGHLFLTVGDRDQRHRAQDLSDHAGTVVRLRDDGSVRGGQFLRGASRGETGDLLLRPSQRAGLAFDAAAGILWEHEHGP
jgi:glucose/arabinose dehydrogenase